MFKGMRHVGSCNAADVPHPSETGMTCQFFGDAVSPFISRVRCRTRSRQEAVIFLRTSPETAEPQARDDRIEALWSDQSRVDRALRTYWSDFPPHTVEEIGGEREKLLVCVRNRYGVCRAEAERRIRAWENLMLHT
jgi:hypothetical protein